MDTTSSPKQDATVEAMMRCSFCGFILIDGGSSIISMNELAEQLLGYHDKPYAGRPLLEILPTLDRELLSSVFADGRQVCSSVMDVYKNHLNIVIDPITADSGERTGAVVALHRYKNARTPPDKMISGKTFNGTYQFDGFSPFTGSFAPLVKQAKYAALTDAQILLCGEEGTELHEIAQSIHNASSRSHRNYMEIECNALDYTRQNEFLFGSSGLHQCAVELCDGGTIFFNHVDKLAPEIQFKICRIIKQVAFFNDDNRQIRPDIRILAATDVDLWSLVEKGLFREDLFYSLSIITLQVPPLRKRRDEMDVYVDYLFEYYGNQYMKPVTLQAGVYNCIKEYDWPGNAKQLASFCQRVLLLSRSRSISEAFARSQMEAITHKVKRRTESAAYIDKNVDAIIAALRNCNGSKSRAAAELGISKTTLWRKMQKYGITTEYTV